MDVDKIKQRIKALNKEFFSLRDALVEMADGDGNLTGQAHRDWESVRLQKFTRITQQIEDLERALAQKNKL